VDRRVDVAEVPLVGGDLPVWVQVLLAQHQLQLLLGKVRIDDVEGDDVKGQIPGRVPRVLPLVGHRDDVRVHHVGPLGVSDRRAAHAVGVDAVLVEPASDVVVEELLAPEHAGERLAHHARGVGRDARRRDRSVEGIRLPAPGLEDRVEVAEWPAPERDDVVW